MADEKGEKRNRPEGRDEAGSGAAAPSRPRTDSAPWIGPPPTVGLSAGLPPSNTMRRPQGPMASHYPFQEHFGQPMRTTIGRGINPLRVGLQQGGGDGDAYAAAEQRARSNAASGLGPGMPRHMPAARPPLPPGPPPSAAGTSGGSSGGMGGGIGGGGSGGGGGAGVGSSGVVLMGRQRGIRHSVQVPADPVGGNAAWMGPSYAPFQSSPGKPNLSFESVRLPGHGLCRSRARRSFHTRMTSPLALLPLPTGPKQT